MKRALRGPYKPLLSVPKILAWADGYFKVHGAWPHLKSGPIKGTVSETWRGVDFALNTGTRGLKIKMSLTAFLRRHRHVYIRRDALTEDMIFAWAKAHHRRTGKWPTYADERVSDAPQESWKALNRSLVVGRRGLRAGSSLRELLEERGARIEYAKRGRPPGSGKRTPRSTPKRRKK